MKIKYTHSAGLIGEIPKGDELARLAADNFGFCLNTAERVNVWHDGPQFAQAIRETCDHANPQTAAILSRLEELGQAA